MTVVLEGAALAAFLGGGALAGKNVVEEGEQALENSVKELYAKYFKADITGVVADARSKYIAESLSDNVDAYATASIRVIERYQREREKKSLMEKMMKSGPVADTRNRVCEEL